jgi:hypothetical protein
MWPLRGPLKRRPPIRTVQSSEDISKVRNKEIRRGLKDLCSGSCRITGLCRLTVTLKCTWRKLAPLSHVRRCTLATHTHSKTKRRIRRKRGFWRRVTIFCVTGSAGVLSVHQSLIVYTTVSTLKKCVLPFSLNPNMHTIIQLPSVEHR